MRDTGVAGDRARAHARTGHTVEGKSGGQERALGEDVHQFRLLPAVSSALGKQEESEVKASGGTQHSARRGLPLPEQLDWQSKALKQELLEVTANFPNPAHLLLLQLTGLCFQSP